MTFWDDNATEAGVFNVADDYHRYTDLQAQWIVDRLDVSEGVVLDLGCGIGRLLRRVAMRRPQLTLVGVDSSRSMLLAAADAIEMFAELWLPEYWLKQDVLYSGAYCVLMFQHVPDTVAASYLADVAERLRSGARFVSQWVTEGESGPLSYPRSSTRIIELHEDAGLTVVEAVPDRDVTGYVDEWLWVVAQKRL